MLANIVLCYSALLVASISTQVNSLKPAASVDSTSANGNARDCLQRANQLDRCLPKLVFYGDRDFDPPRSEQKLDEHCRMLDENVKCVSSYSRECLPSFARNLYSVVLRRLKTQFAKRCKTKDGRRDFINLMACADVQHTEPTHKCMDSFVAQLEHIGSGAQSRQIELICCTFQVFQDCIFAASKRIKCAQRVVTADKSIEYVRGIINSMGGDMMDFMCGKYDKLSACLSGYPAIMAQFKEIANKVHNGTLRPVSKSPIKPMLQLFIDSQEGGEL